MYTVVHGTMALHVVREQHFWHNFLNIVHCRIQFTSSVLLPLRSDAAFLDYYSHNAPNATASHGIKHAHNKCHVRTLDDVIRHSIFFDQSNSSVQNEIGQ